MVLCHSLQKTSKNMFILDSEQANICFYYLKYLLQKPQKQSLQQCELSLQLMSVTWWWWRGNIRQHSFLLLTGTETYLKATMTMMCWTELIPSTLISHQTQCRRETLKQYYHFLLKLFFITILIKTKSSTIFLFSMEIWN